MQSAKAKVCHSRDAQPSSRCMELSRGLAKTAHFNRVFRGQNKKSKTRKKEITVDVGGKKENQSNPSMSSLQQ